MARLQLALNVTDLEAAVSFYGDLLDATPHKRRPGYANFEVSDPPLKLVLFQVGEGSDAVGGTLNHLGVEVTDSAEVAVASARLQAAGRTVDVREQELCCHAVQDKVWTSGPDGELWEVYVVTDDRLNAATDDTCADDSCAAPAYAVPSDATALPVACC